MKPYLSFLFIQVLFLTIIFCEQSDSYEKSNNKRLSGGTSTSTSDDYECLSDTDSNEIVFFMHSSDSFIRQKDTTKFLSLMKFPINVDGNFITVDKFIQLYFPIMTTYLLKNTIHEDELKHLVRHEAFVKQENGDRCFQYIITNSFPELEFNVDIYIEKIEGKIKIVKLDVVG